jgi:hypothetical protein
MIEPNLGFGFGFIHVTSTHSFNFLPQRALKRVFPEKTIAIID